MTDRTAIEAMIAKVEAGDYDEVTSNSYRNFHAKGLDYICLSRSDGLTEKLYFIDGDASLSPEVVNPHDHRYSFTTKVLAGELKDYAFHRDPRGDVFEAFNFMTPLNGGNGFTYRGHERLTMSLRARLTKGQYLSSRHDFLHTIAAPSQTVLLLSQMRDEVPVDTPTSTWSRKGEPRPELSGLYDKFTPDQLLSRLRQARALSQAQEGA